MRFLIILLRFYIVCIALIVVVHSLDWRFWNSGSNTTSVCTTTECQALGKLYLQYMDVKGQPCTDFYDYVCHNWGTYNPRPPEVNYLYLWNIEESLQYRAMLEMKKLLESKSKAPTKAFERAKLLYKTCMEIPEFSRFSPNVIKAYMKKIGVNVLSLPNNAASASQPLYWEIDKRYIALTGESALFGYNFVFHPFMQDNLVTEIKAPLSVYGALRRGGDWPRESQLKHYKAFLNKIALSILDENSQNFKKQIENVVNEVVEFRDKLHKCTFWRGFGPNEVEWMFIKQFQQWYELQSGSYSNEQINWIEMVRAIYTNSNDTRIPKITDSSTVKFHSNYLGELADLLADTPTRVIVNHIQLYFAERHLLWTPEMKADLKESVTEIGVDINGEIIRGTYRWKTCIENNAMKRALGKAYVNSFFPKKQKLEIKELFETAKKLMEQQISESTWLDSNMKQSSIEKLRKITGELGYPDWYDTEKAPESELDDVDPLQIEAHYINELNRVVASAIYFQLPIYNPNLPYVIKYGSTVSVFGHELHHAFDSDGVTYNGEGRSPWWPLSMIKEHSKHTECIEDQYEKMKENEFKSLKLQSHYNFTFENTLDEDMADVMGLKLSYMGFKQMLKKKNGVCPVLPGFEKYGCEQLFFIAFASSFCSTIPQEQQEAMFYEDLHSLPRIRVNGAVANMEEFRTAFGCKAKHPLSVKQTCDFWK